MKRSVIERKLCPTFPFLSLLRLLSDSLPYFVTLPSLLCAPSLALSSSELLLDYLVLPCFKICTARPALTCCAFSCPCSALLSNCQHFHCLACVSLPCPGPAVMPFPALLCSAMLCQLTMLAVIVVMTFARDERLGNPMVQSLPQPHRRLRPTRHFVFSLVLLLQTLLPFLQHHLILHSLLLTHYGASTPATTTLVMLRMMKKQRGSQWPGLEDGADTAGACSAEAAVAPEGATAAATAQA